MVIKTNKGINNGNPEKEVKEVVDLSQLAFTVASKNLEEKIKQEEKNPTNINIKQKETEKE